MPSAHPVVKHDTLNLLTKPAEALPIPALLVLQAYAEFVARLDRAPVPNLRLQKTCKRRRMGRYKIFIRSALHCTGLRQSFGCVYCFYVALYSRHQRLSCYV